MPSSTLSLSRSATSMVAISPITSLPQPKYSVRALLMWVMRPRRSVMTTPSSMPSTVWTAMAAAAAASRAPMASAALRLICRPANTIPTTPSIQSARCPRMRDQVCEALGIIGFIGIDTLMPPRRSPTLYPCSSWQVRQLTSIRKGRIRRMEGWPSNQTTSLTSSAPRSNASSAFLSQRSGAFWGRRGFRLVR